MALRLVNRFGPVSFKNAMEEFGSIDEALKSQPEASLAAADEEIAKAEKAGVGIVTCLDTHYPSALKEIYDPPILLYVKGTLPDDSRLKVAIVGARQCTTYGRMTARAFAQNFAEAGAVVVSGLALGIDTAAHEGALAGKGLTVAVLGGGLNKFYPEDNRKLSEKIAQNGAVITEYPMDMDPSPSYFPVRNRIISGLSRSLVVVEARRRSGSLITVDTALEQGREVFAVPGNIDSVLSEGTNHLIRQGSRMATSAADVLNDELLTPPAGTLTPEEAHLLGLLSRQETPIDEVLERSQMPISQAISTLSLLEIKGLVKQTPGKNYARS